MEWLRNGSDTRVNGQEMWTIIGLIIRWSQVRVLVGAFNSTEPSSAVMNTHALGSAIAARSYTAHFALPQATKPAYTLLSGSSRHFAPARAEVGCRP